MSITNNAELEGMQKISNAVAVALKAMREYAKPGISTKELDDFGGKCWQRWALNLHLF